MNDDIATEKWWIVASLRIHPAKQTSCEKITATLKCELTGVWQEKIGGSDQRCWNLKIEEQSLKLHLEHYLGIVAISTFLKLLLRAQGAVERISI